MNRRITLSVAALVAATSIGGCAPDAWSPQKSGASDKWYDQVAARCGQMRIGSFTIGDALRGFQGQADSTYFLDQTSRLYYGKLTPAAYRDSITGFVGPGSGVDAALDCVVAQLPAR